MSDKETAPCPHVSLKRQNVGNQRWYKCLVCEQKFKAVEWDGKVEVIAAECTAPAPARPSVEVCICDDCERKRAANERILPAIKGHDHTPASAYPARYVAPKEKP